MSRSLGQDTDIAISYTSQRKNRTLPSFHEVSLPAYNTLNEHNSGFEDLNPSQLLPPHLHNGVESEFRFYISQRQLENCPGTGNVAEPRSVSNNRSHLAKIQYEANPLYTVSRGVNSIAYPGNLENTSRDRIPILPSIRDLHLTSSCSGNPFKGYSERVLPRFDSFALDYLQPCPMSAARIPDRVSIDPYQQQARHPVSEYVDPATVSLDAAEQLSPSMTCGQSANIVITGGSIALKVGRRRGNLPKPVTDILRAWFNEHSDHPYPNEEDKQMFMSLTGLSARQVSNWFINARRGQISAQRH